MKARPSPLRKWFAANVRREREARGWSEDELAHLARLHRCRLDAVEAGTRNIDLENIWRLARALGVELPDLCRDRLP